ncbi:threonine/homoserine/homoserine lactone efflux protein [Rudaeicoccus suwonensis]|uniref:Threonine/homoserine/homoserine lactone efflux protein n=2 Tax=Rudaeicoccus suwonensis TaxID=657409 RepID=A0A561ECI3_9MICO|nr:threonine/homoserine/homoserine lactone efflux protein [Rudaeicoccus suwonensis]
MVSLLPLLGAWVIAVIAPGPDFLAVLRTSAAHGRRAGLQVGAGVVSGIACWATLALVGLSTLLARYEHLYLVIRTVGAVLLVAYGLRVLWSTRRRAGDEIRDTEAESRPRGMRTVQHWRLGLFTNLANPKALIFFGALFAALLPHGLGVAGRLGLLVVMLTMALTWFAVVTVCAASRPVVSAYNRLQRTIDRVAGGLFAAIGLTLLPR